MKKITKLKKALAACHSRADDGLYAMSLYWPELEAVLHEIILDELKIVMESLENIQDLVLDEFDNTEAMKEMLDED